MKCLEKAGCSQDKSCYMENGILKAFDIKKPDTDIYKAIRKNLDGIAKPIDGLGRFEDLIARLGAIQGSEQIDISKKRSLSCVPIMELWQKESASPGRRSR